MRKKRGRWLPVALALSLVLVVPHRTAGAEVEPLVAQIRAVGHEGAGNVAAARAWRELVQLGPDALPGILTGLDDADITAANWLRAAVDAIAEHELAAGRPLPADRLETFIRQTQHAGRARRLAYEWLTKVDPAAPARLLPGMLQDPSVELRRDAVAVVLKEAQDQLDRGDKSTATEAYRKALSGARDRDQVDLVAKQLHTLGVEVDLAAHFGFLRKWLLLGPFDSTGGTGFDTVFPPEKGLDLAQTFQGKKGAALHWAEYTTTDPYGLVDLNKAVGKHMGVAAYAFAAVISPTDQPVQIRAGSNNALKIYLNGQLIFAREEYHHGMKMDQHLGRGRFKAGRNEVLVKVCQNEQKDDWAQNWSFQLRICDDVGSALPFTILTERPEARAAGGKRGP